MNPLYVSLCKFCGVAVLLGIIGLIIASSWWGFVLAAILGIIGQILLSWVLDRYEAVRRAKYQYERRLDEAAILDANSVTAECASCHTVHKIPIIASERNLFSCSKCANENVILLNVETALTTNPIENKPNNV